MPTFEPHCGGQYELGYLVSCPLKFFEIETFRKSFMGEI